MKYGTYDMNMADTAHTLIKDKNPIDGSVKVDIMRKVLYIKAKQ